MREDARVHRRLKLRQLDALLAVAQNGSMAKAAEYLSVSQPAVSKAIADMEHTLGVRLFDRTTQGVEPTVYGQALLKSARAVFDDVRQGIKEIEFLADPTGGELRVATLSTMIASILPHIVNRIQSQLPRISVHVSLTTSPVQALRDLRERNFDLILTRTPDPIADDIVAETLFYEQIFVMAGTNNRWSRRRKIDLAELINEPWVLPPSDTIVASLVAEAFRSRGLDLPRGTVITGTFELTTTLMANGRCLAIGPNSVLRFGTERRQLKVLPVELPVPPWPIAIVTLKNRTLTPVAQVFIQCAHEIAKPLAKTERRSE